MTRLLNCPLCGHQFDVDTALPLCAGCSIGPGCGLICCPNCGHGTIDVDSSPIAHRLAKKLLRSTEPTPTRNGVIPLADLPSGSSGSVARFDLRITPDHRQRLQALGITPGRRIEVVQQSMVTILRVDQTELAVERDVTRWILVTSS